MSPSRTTKTQVLAAMQNLYSCMDTTARIMELSRRQKIRDKAKELQGAVSILETWIEEVN